MHMISGSVGRTVGIWVVGEGGSMNTVEYIVERPGGGGLVVMRTSSVVTGR